MSGWRARWAARDPRERRAVVVLVVLLVVGGYVWLIHSAQHARARLAPAVVQLQAEAAQLQAEAHEIARLRAAPTTPQPQTELRQLMVAQVEAAGLSHALAGIEVSGTNQAKLVFAPVPFEQWLGLLKSTQAQHIRLTAARMEAQSAPGLVSVTATFVRPQP
ncbi:MAG TPA: type II secretion system protein GspM [Rhodanobacter sp.]